MSEYKRKSLFDEIVGVKPKASDTVRDYLEVNNLNAKIEANKPSIWDQLVAEQNNKLAAYAPRVVTQVNMPLAAPSAINTGAFVPVTPVDENLIESVVDYISNTTGVDNGMFGTEATTVSSIGLQTKSDPTYLFNEGKYIVEAKAHIDKTYSGHYSGQYQATSIIIDAGHGTGFNIGNIIKYAKRYGKKDGYNKADLMKIIHYAIMQMYVHDEENLS